MLNRAEIRTEILKWYIYNMEEREKECDLIHQILLITQSPIFRLCRLMRLEALDILFHDENITVHSVQILLELMRLIGPYFASRVGTLSLAETFFKDWNFRHDLARSLKLFKKAKIIAILPNNGIMYITSLDPWGYWPPPNDLGYCLSICTIHRLLENYHAHQLLSTPIKTQLIVKVQMCELFDSVVLPLFTLNPSKGKKKVVPNFEGLEKLKSVFMPLVRRYIFDNEMRPFIENELLAIPGSERGRPLSPEVKFTKIRIDSA
jgi:hypothetical protein